MNEGNSDNLGVGCDANRLAVVGVPAFDSVGDRALLVDVFPSFLPWVPEGRGNGRGVPLTGNVLVPAGPCVLENLGGTGGGMMPHGGAPRSQSQGNINTGIPGQVPGNQFHGQIQARIGTPVSAIGPQVQPTQSQ